MNVLPLIADWLDEFVYSGEYAPNAGTQLFRVDLIRWLEKKGVTKRELAADAMIAAGIGRSEEQGQTVYCRVSYG